MHWIVTSIFLHEQTMLQTESKDLHRPTHFQALKSTFQIKICFMVDRVWRVCSFVLALFLHKPCIAECPLAFKNWELAVHLTFNNPCSFTSPRKFLNKAASSDCLVVNCYTHRMGGFLKRSLPSWRGKGTCM